MSFDIRKFLTENKLTKASRLLKENISVNGKQVNRGSVEVDGVDPSDYPDFSDAYITYAEFDDGTSLSDEELDQMSSYAHEFAAESLQENNPVETLDSQPADVDPTDGRGVNTSFDPSKYESVDQLMREIEVTANRASLQEKMKRVKEAYESLEQKATALEEGEDSKYVSSAKLKEMKKNAKTLRKMYEKYEKDYDKRFNEEMKPKKKKMNEQSSVAEQIRLKKKVN